MSEAAAEVSRVGALPVGRDVYGSRSCKLEIELTEPTASWLMAWNFEDRCRVASAAMILAMAATTDEMGRAMCAAGTSSLHLSRPARVSEQTDPLATFLAGCYRDGWILGGEDAFAAAAAAHARALYRRGEAASIATMPDGAAGLPKLHAIWKAHVDRQREAAKAGAG